MINKLNDDSKKLEQTLSNRRKKKLESIRASKAGTISGTPTKDNSRTHTNDNRVANYQTGTLNGNDRIHTEVPNNNGTTQIDNSTETHTNDTEVPNNNCTTQIDNSTETHTTDVSSMARRRNRRFVRNKRQNHPNDSVINLSNTELTVPQERLLSRGLNYVPKPPAPNQ